MTPSGIIVKFSLFLLLSLTPGCILDHEKVFVISDFLDALSEDEITFTAVPVEIDPSLSKFSGSVLKKNAFQVDNISFILIECKNTQLSNEIELDKNSTSQVFRNENLALIVRKGIEADFIASFQELKEPLSYKQAGIFIYPLTACLLLAVFIFTERIYSLRPGLTFPRKVEKALRSGEFPNKKWKRYSAAERIVHVAIHEKPSHEALLAYSRLEVAALEKGLFLLEVVVAAAPLIGLLGTATGLVQVFSTMPASGLSDGTEIFSEGIALALLTTIIGLGIAIPALIGHAYLIRIVEKRAASLDWLTARLIDAVGTNKASFKT
ncbi:MotA/TolQ/ExbB proton channel family protein [Opitutales bacterium]|nr:MotA/TolQ/ExbB proton channel family protein [Opitutales bacterium]